MRNLRYLQLLLSLFAALSASAQSDVPHHLPTLPNWKLIEISPEWVGENPSRVAFGGGMVMGEGIPDEYWIELFLPKPSPYVVNAEFVSAASDAKDAGSSVAPFSTQTWCPTPSKSLRLVFQELCPKRTKPVFSVSIMEDRSKDGDGKGLWSILTYRIDFRQWEQLILAHHKAKRR